MLIGSQDRHVALLVRLPRLGLLRTGELRAKGVELPVRVLDLAVHHLQPDREGSDMRGGRLGGARRDLDGLLAQGGQGLIRADAPDPRGFQQTLNGRLMDSGRLRGRRNQRPQGQKPVRSGIVREFEQLRVIPPELLADAVAQPVPLLPQVLGHARPFAEFDRDRIGRLQRPEAMPVGAQRIRQHAAVETVVLGARDSESIPETIELFGIDRMDREAAFHQRLYHRAVRHFDGHGDRLSRRACRRQQPIAHRTEAFAAVRERMLAVTVPWASTKTRRGRGDRRLPI